MRLKRLTRVGRILMRDTFRWMTSVSKRKELGTKIIVPLVLLVGTWSICKMPGSNNCSVFFMNQALMAQFGPDVMFFLALATMAFLGIGMTWAHSGWKRDEMREFTYLTMKLINETSMWLVGCSLAMAATDTMFAYFIVYSWALVALFVVLWFGLVFLARMPLVVTVRRPLDAYIGMVFGIALFVGALYSESYVVHLVHLG